MQSPSDVIDALGGTGEVAGKLGIEPGIVSGWRRRGIPSHRWPALVRLASDRECIGVTFETLASLTEPKEPAEARA